MAKVFSIGGHTISYGGFMLREQGVGSLTITKTVSGVGFDPAKTFEIVVTFGKAITYKVNGTAILTPSNVYVANLASGQSVTLSEIPEGTTYNVAETPLSQADIEAGYLIDRIENESGTILINPIESIAHNAIGVPAKTARFQFSNLSYDPSQNFPYWSPEGSSTFTWTRVSSNPNIWDYHRESSNWQEAFHCDTYYNYHFGNQDTGDIILLDANLYGVTNVDELFSGCQKLKEARSIRNTESISRTIRMFASCSSLISVPLFDTSNVNDMHSMFGVNLQHTHGPLITEVPLYDTSKVTNMVGMFSYCSRLVSVPLFDTSKVTLMSSMFCACDNIVSVPNFNTSKVTSMANMFGDCHKLKHGPDIDTTKVTDMSYMFAISEGYTSSLMEVPNYRIDSVTDVEYMFYRCENVGGGALSMYNRLASKNPQPSPHTACFYRCGVNTTTGAAELAQIPSGWKSLS